MIFTKKEILRAINEFIEYVSNVNTARFENYTLRSRQLFQLINNNKVLQHIVLPLIIKQKDSSKYGLKDAYHDHCKVIIPEDEDDEISVILNILDKFSNDEDYLMNATVNIYHNTSVDDNIMLFHNDFIVPALNKLLRKMRYLLEDVSEMENEIEDDKIQIFKGINITANNSIVAIGKNINQKINSDVFTEIKNTIEKEIYNEKDKQELLELLNNLKEKKDDKKAFGDIYNLFLMKISSYMSIIGPFLPALAEHLK